MIRLRPEDWSEIFYALESKLSLLHDGRFGTEMEPGQDARWIAHLSGSCVRLG